MLLNCVFLCNRETALHIAARAGNSAIVSALLQNNADYDAVNVNNDNSLHVAVQEGHLNVVSNNYIFKYWLLYLCNNNNNSFFYTFYSMLTNKIFKFNNIKLLFIGIQLGLALKFILII